MEPDKAAAVTLTSSTLGGETDHGQWGEKRRMIKPKEAGHDRGHGSWIEHVVSGMMQGRRETKMIPRKQTYTFAPPSSNVYFLRVVRWSHQGKGGGPRPSDCRPLPPAGQS